MSLLRCFFCDRTTRFPARVTLTRNGLLTCHDCRNHDSKENAS